MGEMFLQNISNKTAQQLMCTCTIAVGQLSFRCCAVAQHE